MDTNRHREHYDRHRHHPAQGKLDGYREDKRRGKELNEDQKSAVAK